MAVGVFERDHNLAERVLKRLHARSPVSRLATRAFFRLADSSPWLRKRAIDTDS
jgi:hypothetical protein